MSPELMNLPWTIQVALATGFLGYAVGFASMRDRHRPVDVAFITLVFGLVGGAVYQMIEARMPGQLMLATLCSVAATVAVGALWSWRGRRWTLALLRGTSISRHDDAPSAWRSIIERGNEIDRISQISVTLVSGVSYICKNTHRFNDVPFGPCLLGPDGSVGLYVTHWQSDDGEETENTTVVDSEWGAEFTVLPASQIRDVEIRLLTS